jgi:sialidase-1
LFSLPGFIAFSLSLLCFHMQLAFAQTPATTPVPACGFEQAMSGGFESLNSALGVWRLRQGSAIVDEQHAKSGRHCLRLHGGERTDVILELSKGIDTSGKLSFWAERWTRRAPFTFRIDKYSRGRWQEIYVGDEQIRVGRAFLSHVGVPLLDDEIEKLRFRCTSPAKTGILIDDVRLSPAEPQQIVDVRVEPLTLPALVGVDSSPLAVLEIETRGFLDPLTVTELQAQITGVENIASLMLSDDAGNWEQLKMPVLSGQLMIWKPTDWQLDDGVNRLTIRCQLKADADIDEFVGVSLGQVSFSNGKRLKMEASPSTQRLGVAVRKGGDDGVHTYRIPGLATTNAGTLIGVYDVRRRSGGDLPGDIDVGMSRSTDGGRNWEPMKIIMDQGDDPAWRYDGVGDPAVLVDRQTGTIWVAATWSHGNRSWHGSGPGLNPEQTGQLLLARSDDDGLTWSKPINITEQVKRPEWSFLLQGPGKGITMRDGTLVFAAQYQDPPSQDPPSRGRLPHSTILYSKDHGRTWKVGNGAYDDTTEAQVVELEPGVLMLNCRYNRKPARVVMITRDLGKTWQPHPTSQKTLIEPGACMASLIDVGRETGRKLGKWLLFSNPNSLQGRNHLTIKASFDGGLTWPKNHQLLLDQGNSAGYSCMSMVDETTVGILYEGSQAHMTFQRIPLKQIVE